MRHKAVASRTAAPTGSLVAGYVGHWDFSNNASVTISTGISQINDLSGNGKHLVQATGSKQPSHTTSASLGGGTLKIASFDSVDDVLETATDVTAGDFTVFAVARKRGTGQDSDADTMFDNNGSGAYATGGGFYVWTGTSAATVTTTWSLVTTAAVHVMTKTSGNDCDYWIDSTQYVTTAAGSAGTGVLAVGGNPGSGNTGNYDIGEIVAYNTVLSSGDIATNRSYLASKWGI